ncbi:hypothetical protein [Serratia marcescens]|uniref:hypothetical protein n=1 Tax=Serratia marcescens TaxID=615 RepID=UPI001F5BF755|nr:hypothetical protein [Serratia marcescens]
MDLPLPLTPSTPVTSPGKAQKLRFSSTVRAPARQLTASAHRPDRAFSIVMH